MDDALLLALLPLLALLAVLLAARISLTALAEVIQNYREGRDDHD
jgi:hypothetical protein